ncbi:hypothetical protein GQ53DRAFT_840948 [Thozetella sp. PMI_491]|nr:hypothetical protein GQ53DRAFT_840948 [Thozetella sp. PMI_491]
MQVRRIKCDEEKPFCRRCTSTGRKCDGYSPPPGSKHQDSLVAMAPAPAHMLSFLPDDSELQRRCLAMHVGKAGDQLTCHQTSYWREILLPLAYEHPTIRYALVSLSLFFQDWQQDIGLRHRVNSVALEQYNLAIKYQLRSLNSGKGVNSTVALACAPIFVTIEMIRGNFASATTIVYNSVQMLWDLLDAESNGFVSARGEVPPELAESPLAVIAFAYRLMLIQMGRDAAGLEGELMERFSYPALPSPPPPAVTCATMPTTFRSTQEARGYMDLLADAFVTRNLREGPDHTKDGRCRPQPSSQYILYRWRACFEDLLHNLPKEMPLSEDDPSGILTLEIRWAFLFLAVLSNSLREECKIGKIPWEGLTDITKTISFVETDGFDGTQSPQPAFGRQSPVFLLEVAVVAPVLAVIQQRHDPVLQRQALDVLERHSRSVEFYPDRVRIHISERYTGPRVMGGVESAGDTPLSARISYSRILAERDLTELVLVYTRNSRGLWMDLWTLDSAGVLVD